MESTEKHTDDTHEDTEKIVETPLFMRFRQWWRAKKVSLDLWGIEKYLGCDPATFKEALAAYKNLLAEIQHEFYERAAHSSGKVEEIEEAKRQRDQMLLDAKRDFVYRMPEDYRIWFKKRKIFNSWRFSPENWGFHESRYWGSRSGLTLRERRVILVAILLVAFVALAAMVGIFRYEKPPAVTERVIMMERDTTINIDSLARAKVVEEQRMVERKRLEKLYIERKNRMINQLNAGFYVTETTNMRSEVVQMMSTYLENVLKMKISTKTLSDDLEAVGTTLVLIEQKNPKLITSKGPFGLPRTWREGARAKIGWEDVKAGVDVYVANRAQKNE